MEPKPKFIHIYTLVDPRNGQVRYVGKTVDPKNRLSVHLKDGDRTYRGNWIKSLKREGYTPEMRTLEIVSSAGTEWQEREKFWIQFYRQQGFQLTNLTDGGEGCLGREVSSETRRKISTALKGNPKIIAALTGRKASEKTRQKMSESLKKSEAMQAHVAKLHAANVGVPRPEEVRQKLRMANIGKTHSMETRLKMSMSHRNSPIEKERLRRQRISHAQTGRVLSDEWKNAMKEGWRRRCGKPKIPASEEHRKNLSIAGKKAWLIRKEKINGWTR